MEWRLTSDPRPNHDICSTRRHSLYKPIRSRRLFTHSCEEDIDRVAAKHTAALFEIVLLTFNAPRASAFFIEIGTHPRLTMIVPLHIKKMPRGTRATIQNNSFPR
jgi:hypothetical protein